MATKKPAKTNRSPKEQDALALLAADHKEVSGLFDKYEKARSPATKKPLAAEICNSLTIHAQIEEEIFYPAVKRALKDKELVPEAAAEHAGIKTLIAEVEGMELDSEVFDAKMKVMHEYVKHHVEEEQNEMFPKVKSAGLDLVELGAQLGGRKAELLAQRA
jgi:hemerythrin superfamily protein